MEMTPEQWLICWAVLEMKAIDAEAGDNDKGLVEFELLETMPTVQQLREIANEAKKHLTPEQGTIL